MRVQHESPRTAHICVVVFDGTPQSRIDKVFKDAKEIPLLEGFDEHVFWLCHGGHDLYQAVRKSGLQVSNLPEIVDISDEDLFGRPGEATCPERPDLAARSVLDFDLFVPGSVLFGDFRSGSISCMSRWPEVRDSAVMIGKPQKSDTKKIKDMSWRGAPFHASEKMSFYRNMRVDVIWTISFHIARNTAPLIYSESVRGRKGSYSIPFINAANIQEYFSSIHDGREEFNSNIFSTSEDSGYFFQNHQKVLTDAGRRLMEKMHPTARDPKFRDRSLGWVRDWPESRPEMEKWIKTWAGRLRRLQAKRYKASVARAGTINAITASMRTFLDENPTHLMRRDYHSDDDFPIRVAGEYRLASALSMMFAASEREILEEMLACQANIMREVSDVAPPKQILDNIARSESFMSRKQGLFMMEESRPVPGWEALLQDMPVAWAEGVRTGISTHDAGWTSPVSILSRGDPTILVEDFEEEIFRSYAGVEDINLNDPFVKNPFISASSGRVDRGAGFIHSVFRIKISIPKGDLVNAATRMAFARGKCAAWLALSSNGGEWGKADAKERNLRRNLKKEERFRPEAHHLVAAAVRAVEIEFS